MYELRSRTTNHFRSRLRKLWATRGGGFYGFVAVLTFLYIEALDLAGDLKGLPGSGPVNAGWIIGRVVDFFVDAIVNTVQAAIWPVHWIGRFGVSILSAALLAGSYVAYRAIRPAVLRWLDTTDEELAALAAESARPKLETR
jgi:hypothetical protein